MKREEHLLTILIEECAEVQQRATKALRFGMNEIQPDQPFTNEDRLFQEVCDLKAIIEMLGLNDDFEYYAIERKKEKVEKYLNYSKQCGTLNEDDDETKTN